MSVDTVSLPPTYAPSEAYSDSPPPAYKRSKSTTVQVARMVCITLLAVAFMIGFFVITSNYLSAKQCDCSKHEDLHTASVLPSVEKLVGAEELNKVEEMNGNAVEEEASTATPKTFLEKEGEEIAVPDAQEELDDNVPLEEVQAFINDVAEIEDEAEREKEQMGVQDIMNQEIEDIKKKIKLPIDLILGNPTLAGRDVNCEVERRQQPIGGGIVTQAIIVTCSDNDDEEAKVEGPGFVMTPPGPRRLGPPLSLLAPIMKMLTAKAMARQEKPIEIKTINAIPIPFPPQTGPQPCSPNGPFPCFMNQPVPFPGPMNGPMPGPFNGPMPNPFFGPFPGPFPGPMNGPFPGPMNGPFPGPFPDTMNGPFPGPMGGPMGGPFPGPMGGPFPDSFSGPNPGPISGPFPDTFIARNPNSVNTAIPDSMNRQSFGPFPDSMPRQDFGSFPDSMPRQNFGPFPNPKSGPAPGSISRQIHVPLNAPIPPIPNAIPFPEERPTPPRNLIPSSFFQGPRPEEENDDSDDEPRNRMLPIALRPLVRITPRMPRILAFATNPDRQGAQARIASLQRGINNMASREPKILSSNLPPFLEPQRRALEEPVSLPGLKFLPARLLSAPAFLRGIRRDEPHPMTHMELRHSEPESKEIDFEPRFPDFGPPRDQTIISSNQPPRIINEFPPNMSSKMEMQSNPQIVSKTIEVSGPFPIDIMSPPKPIAILPNNQPIAGPFFTPPPPPPPPSSENLPPPPPPEMDPQGRSGFVSDVNPDAEMLIRSEPSSEHQPPPPEFIRQFIQEQQQLEDERKHHLLVLN